jgi:hypothetical protein
MDGREVFPNDEVIVSPFLRPDKAVFDDKIL